MLKEIRKNYKRLVAFLLSITMIIMNMGGNAITAFAGEEREISLFMAEGEKILEAAAHLQDQEEFTKEDLEEMGLDAPKNSIIKKYEKLFLPEEGKIYELDVDIDDHLAAEGTELRIFYHSKEKEVIFLFLNESNQDIDFCVNIDGYETELVTVEKTRMKKNPGKVPAKKTMVLCPEEIPAGHPQVYLEEHLEAAQRKHQAICLAKHRMILRIKHLKARPRII